MGSGRQDHLRQVSCVGACQRCGRRSAEGGVFPARTRETRIDQRQEVAAIKPLEEPEWRAPRGFERTVPDEQASVQGLPAQGGSRGTMGLQISRGHAELSRLMDGTTEMAAVGAVGGVGRHAAQNPGRYGNLLQTKGPLRSVEAVNGNIRMSINRGRGYKNLRYLLLKAKRMAVTNVEFLAVQRVKKVA